MPILSVRRETQPAGSWRRCRPGFRSFVFRCSFQPPTRRCCRGRPACLPGSPGGGAFSAAVQAACGRRAGRACFLDLAPVCCRVRLGKSAPPERLSPAALAEALTGPVFYNAPLGCHLQADPYRRRPPLHPFRHRRVFSSAPHPSRAPAPDRPLASPARIGRALQYPRF